MNWDCLKSCTRHVLSKVKKYFMFAQKKSCNVLLSQNIIRAQTLKLSFVGQTFW